MGRPPVDTEQVSIRIDRAQLAQIDAWRRAEEDLPGRPEAIRRMVAAFLQQASGPETNDA